MGSAFFPPACHSKLDMGTSYGMLKLLYLNVPSNVALTICRVCQMTDLLGDTVSRMPLNECHIYCGENVLCLAVPMQLGRVLELHGEFLARSGSLIDF